MPDYEIELVYFGKGFHHETIIGILTGYSLDEILAKCPRGRNIWFTRDYLDTFRALGFNVNPRFKDFDPETPWPCIMRCKCTMGKDTYWYGWVYYQGQVYSSHNEQLTFEEWIAEFGKRFRVTSMLQVWV